MSNERKLDRQLEEEFASDVLDLRKKLDKIQSSEALVEKDNTKGSGKTLKLIFISLAVAASFALVSMLLPQLFTTSSTGEIYASNYEPYPMALNQRGDAEKILNDAIAAYISQKYQVAADAFTELYSQNEDALYLLYAGNAYQASEQYNKALTAYDQVINSADARVVEQAQWYKGLTLLKLNRIDEVQKLFNEFEETHYKYDEAMNILAKL
ncbi:tetratricopeptide repeat protein [Portibacter marinus]|uniref:tetratricopeptide repeat protein n=1 Tax=Portibacter marinus TaxID=2898660 RepID=UPI001F263B81|nr:hypothetical protein [Portibacter marinus]